MNLLNKIALVTGASSGIGRAIAIALANSGCKVIVTGRNKDRLQQVVEKIGSNQAFAVELEMTDDQAIQALPAQLPNTFCNPSILINNAAEDIGGRTRFDMSTADEISRVIEINLIGTIRIVRAFVPAMIEKSEGDIITIGSTNALRPTLNMAAYTASKSGLHGLTDVLRADYAKSGIRVMEIIPGLTKTSFATTRMRGNETKANEFFNQFPSHLEPEEVAEAALFALSRPRHINVQQLTITPSFQW